MPPPPPSAAVAPLPSHQADDAPGAAVTGEDAPLEVAVIGSGIAGLSAAWLLSQPDTADGAVRRALRVRLYEKAPALGMDAEAMDADVQYVDGAGEKRTARMRLDMPLRVFTESYYPHLTGLYDHVGVEYQPEDYSGSFSTYQPPASASAVSTPARLFFGYRNWLVGALSVPLVFLPLWRSLLTRSSWRILRDLMRFHWQARKQLRAWAKEGPDAGREETLGAYLHARNYSTDFIQRMLLPTLAGILTCSHASVLAYPAPIVLAYWCKRSLRGVRRVCQGTQCVVTNLTRNVSVSLSTGVQRIESFEDATLGRTRVRVTDETGGVAEFDHVVVACQANHAFEMLQHSCKDQALLAALRGIRYERSRLITHSDPALMPRDRDVWNSVNFILPETPTTPLPAPARAASDASTTAVADATTADLPLPISSEGMATIWLNRAQCNLRALGPQCTPLFQSWNPLTGVLPSPDLTLHDSVFERPVVTPASLRCVEAIASKQGAGHVWFCGSYAEPGMPLLETAVASAVRVARRLGQACPWEHQLADKNATTHASAAGGTSTGSSSKKGMRLGLGFGLALLTIAGAVFAQKANKA